MGCCIKSIATYLPETILSNEMLEKEFPDWNAQKITDKVGIQRRHLCGPDLTALDLAENACRNLSESESLEDVDFLLFCTQSPDYILPPNACLLQKRLGLSNSIGALDFNLGCSGFIYGLSLAKGLISAGMAKKVMLVTSETYSRHLNRLDRGNRSIFGDGAAVALIQECEEEHIHRFAFGTDGGGAENLIIRNGGCRSGNIPDAPLVERSKGSSSTDNDLYMNGPEIFNFTISTVPDLVSRTLAANELSLDDMDYFVFHQANKYILNFLRKLIKIPEEKFYVNMEETGNIVSATIPWALQKAQEEKCIRPGQRLLLAGFGVGYSYGATVVDL